MFGMWVSNFIDTVEEVSSKRDIKGLKIFTVKSLNPLIFVYDEIEIGTSLGDTILLHPLFKDENINLDLDGIEKPQQFVNSTAYNSPSFEAKIEGTIPEFLKGFYEFYKTWQAAYILRVGDMVACYEMTGNTFVVLQKVLPEIVEESDTDSNNKDGENNDV